MRFYTLLTATLCAILSACVDKTTTGDTAPSEADVDTDADADSDTDTDADSDTDTAPPQGSAGCGAETYTSGTYELEHGGLTRRFQVLVPASHDPETPAPLVLAFHGWGGDEDEFLGSAAVRDEAEARGFLVAAPLGLGAGPPDRSWASWAFSGSTTGLDGDGVNAAVPGDTPDICDDDRTTDYDYPSCEGVADNGCSWTHCQADDLDFVLELIEALGSGLCVDPQAVFATGGSNGGMFTWELGQDPRTASSFRALAPLIGLPHRGYLAPPGTEAALPVLSLTGTRDPTVPPGEWEDPSFTTTTDGDHFYYTGATAITRVWAEAHGCDTTQPAEPFGEGIEEMDCRSYCTPGGGWPEVLDCRADMRHTYNLGTTWPLVLDFFEAHR
jgi:poly(3-hydroxybutyrate) depolymerase